MSNDCAVQGGANGCPLLTLSLWLALAHELRDIGIDSNCAPMLDVANTETHPFLRNCCYGTDVLTVTSMGRAAADGLLDGGILPVVKHILGHGRATADSHFDLHKVDAPHDSLVIQDFSPFKALNDLPIGMTTHLVYTEIVEAPATLSKQSWTSSVWISDLTA